MTLGKRFYDKYSPYVLIILCAMAVYSLIYAFSGSFSPTAPNHYNSFSRQAVAWLSGRLSLPENVSWLELAIFEGNYYVSFTPFPSIVMLPFTLIFGIETPDHMIALGAALISLVYAYKLGFKLLGSKQYAVLFSLFLILGTNYLHVALWGAVWYIAQNLAFLLTLISFYYAVTDNKNHSYISLFALCAAMGCRPFNILYLPIILFLIYRREAKTFLGYVKKIFVYAIPAIVLGVFYMWLNYARFGNVFDFGHNYLPEFVNDPNGQFYIGRVPDNLKRIFTNLEFVGFPLFRGFALWLASPIVVSYFAYLLIYIYRSARKIPMISEENDHTRLIVFTLFFLTMIHIFAFSFHRTLGEHQFGSRYTVDILPAFYFSLLLLLRKIPLHNSIYLNIVPMIFGLLLNFHGTVQYLAYYFPIR